MYNFIAIITALIIPIIILKKDLIKKENLTIKEYIIKNKYYIVVCFILILGFLVRLVDINKLPAGLNQDEASAGYDAYSVLKYGVDRNGQSVPIYFIAWGSGQSTLLSYLMIPFILIFGLSELTIRIPMAIIGCVSLILVYKLLKEHNKKIAIIGLIFFAICPWHIMKSRWALDCNLFPDLVLIAVYIIIKALKNKKMYLYYIGIAVLSISTYSYATSYMFLPIFMILLTIHLLKNKYIKVKNAIISAIIALIIATPIIIFVIINTFDLNAIKIGPITIPRLYENRYESSTTIFSGVVFENLINNIVRNFDILIHQYDGAVWNAMNFYGMFYIFTLPFTIIGLFKSITEKKLEYKILNIWFVVSILLTIVFIDGNINRMNIIIIPLVFYSILGLYVIMQNHEIIIPIIATYSISFAFFLHSYIKTQGKEGNMFSQDIGDAIRYVETMDFDKIYLSYTLPQPYIYALFYSQASPIEYWDTVEFYNQKIAFENVMSFGKYYFYTPNSLDEENIACIIPTSYEVRATEDINIIEFGRYKVLYK